MVFYKIGFYEFGEKESMIALERDVLDGDLRELSRYFYALKDILRLRILVMLAHSGAMTVTELAHALRVSQPLVSFHLRPLRTVGLVTVHREGREVRCSANLEEVCQRHETFIALLEAKQ